MKGVDTNVLVRFFIKDEPHQSKRAAEFMRNLTTEEPGFISLVALAELFWVLRSQYRASRDQLFTCVESLLDSPQLVIENQAAVSRAASIYATSKADFADCLIGEAGRSSGCGVTVTFDKDAARLAGMMLL